MNEMTGKSLADQLKHYDNWPTANHAEDREAIDEACLLMDAGSAEIERLTETVSLRDQFAMAAMSGILTTWRDTINAIDIAQSSYLMADAMLKVRDQ